MTEPNDLHPYSLDVQPIPSKPGRWQWAIRKHGRMLQRSDRSHPSETEATRDGLKTVERLLAGRD
ncbi:hypothetical protein [Methylobacterium nigriterrae]|uniref:hypothetical protein n=1 Tax=Methylobacterium nigriterrae TaxID=3127512 RepID=UPI003013517E